MHRIFALKTLKRPTACRLGPAARRGASQSTANTPASIAHRTATATFLLDQLLDAAWAAAWGGVWGGVWAKRARS